MGSLALQASSQGAVSVRLALQRFGVMVSLRLSETGENLSQHSCEVAGCSASWTGGAAERRPARDTRGVRAAKQKLAQQFLSPTLSDPALHFGFGFLFFNLLRL